jgi:hypothetical protein
VGLIHEHAEQVHQGRAALVGLVQEHGARLPREQADEALLRFGGVGGVTVRAQGARETK